MVVTADLGRFPLLQHFPFHGEILCAYHSIPGAPYGRGVVIITLSLISEHLHMECAQVTFVNSAELGKRCRKG